MLCRWLLVLALAVGMLSVVGPQVAGAALPYVVYGGVTATNQLIWFSSTVPGTIDQTVVFTGLVGGDASGIDFRPATGQLYVFGDLEAASTRST